MNTANNPQGTHLSTHLLYNGSDCLQMISACLCTGSACIRQSVPVYIQACVGRLYAACLCMVSNIVPSVPACIYIQRRLYCDHKYIQALPFYIRPATQSNQCLPTYIQAVTITSRSCPYLNGPWTVIYRQTKLPVLIQLLPNFCMWWVCLISSGIAAGLSGIHVLDRQVTLF